MEGDLFPFRSLRHSSILKFALLVVIAIFVGVGGAKADNDAAIARQKAANQKLEAARCHLFKFRHHHAECGRQVMAQIPAGDRDATFMRQIDVLARLDQNNSEDDKAFALLDRALRDPRVDLKAAMKAKEDNYGPSKDEHDAALARQLAATWMINLCSEDRYKHHHVECGQRVMAQTPPENRNETFMKYVDELLPAYDKNDRDLDKINESFDRHIRDEHFARDLKAATPGTGEIPAIVRRYCTGRGEPRIGMTELEVTQGTTWCVPSSVNETITASGKRRQFVYRPDFPGSGGNRGFLYFEDGRLVAIQRGY